jgi:hypothetical protein
LLPAQRVSLFPQSATQFLGWGSAASGAAPAGSTRLRVHLEYLRNAYVVGGFTGTRWLDTVVAWRPGAALSSYR